MEKLKTYHALVLNTNQIVDKKISIVLDHLKYIVTLKKTFKIIIEDSKPERILKEYHTPYTTLITSLYSKNSIFTRSVKGIFDVVFHVTLNGDLKQFQALFNRQLIEKSIKCLYRAKQNHADRYDYPIKRLIFRSDDPIRILNTMNLVNGSEDVDKIKDFADIGNFRGDSFLNLLFAFWFTIHWYLNSFRYTTSDWNKSPTKEIRISVSTPDFMDANYSLFSGIVWRFIKTFREKTHNTKYYTFREFIVLNRENEQQYTKTTLKDLIIFNNNERILGWWSNGFLALFRFYIYVSLGFLMCFNYPGVVLLIKDWKFLYFFFELVIACKIINGKLYISKEGSRDNADKESWLFWFIKLKWFKSVLIATILLIGTNVLSIGPINYFFKTNKKFF